MKKLTVIGIIGKTHGVKRAANPLKNDRKKITNKDFFSDFSSLEVSKISFSNPSTSSDLVNSGFSSTITISFSSEISGISNSSTPGSRVSNSFQSSSGAVLPGMIPPRRPQSLTSPSPRVNSGSLPGVPSSVSPVSQVSAPISTSSSVGGASLNQGTNSGVTSSISNPVSSQGDEIDLSTLPPPPPPPNILPPSGPPDIIPSRDE